MIKDYGLNIVDESASQSILDLLGTKKEAQGVICPIQFFGFMNNELKTHLSVDRINVDMVRLFSLDNWAHQMGWEANVW